MFRSLYHRLTQAIPALGHLTVRQFIKFSLVGVSNTLLDFSLYFILTRALLVHFLVANAIAFILAASWSYAANKAWTFRDTSRDMTAQYTKFILISLVGLALNEGILSLFVLLFGVPDLLAKALAVVIVVGWNFSANRAWTFTQRREPVVKID